MALLEVGVNYQYSTIQNAVNSAPDGGCVRVNPAVAGNIYNEAVTVNNKRVRLFGGVPSQGILIAGAGGGAAPALVVTGTGAVNLENFSFSNVGSAATYVVELNVAEDWITHCIIDGGGTARCLQSQFGDHCLLQNGVRGNDPSCPGQVLFTHFTCVNMSAQGIAGNGVTGTYQACLTYNCNNLGFLNAGFQYCAWNAGDDVTVPGPDSLAGLSLAEIAFVNYAGGDFRLSIASKAFSFGVDPMQVQMGERLRLRSGPDNRIYAGCYDPFPAAPAWLTGSSQLRVMY